MGSDLPTHLFAVFCPQELLHYLIGTLLLLIASVVAASKSYNQSGLVAGAVRMFSEPLRTNSRLRRAFSSWWGQGRGWFLGPFFIESIPTLI
jgi:hypothetical protein